MLDLNTIADAGERPCRICGGTDYSPVSDINGFRIQRCVNCTLVQITDDLSQVDLKSVYSDDNFEFLAWQHDGKGKTIAYEKLYHRLDEIEKYRPNKGEMLEIGCAFGYFLDAARSRGWTPTGVEIAEQPARFAREKLNLPIQCCWFKDAELPEGHFDVVAMWDALEHFDDPAAELLHAHKLIRDGGLLAFNTPDVDSFIRKLQGSRWRNFIPPQHITYFNVAATKELFRRTGFRPLWFSVALPREALLKKLHLYDLLVRIKLSDKMFVIAEKI